MHWDEKTIVLHGWESADRQFKILMVAAERFIIVDKSDRSVQVSRAFSTFDEAREQAEDWTWA